ncbi:MAG: (d)CMP kinase [Eubacterium sp.]|jgi:cytidylate kinase|uniref:Cytidylate kinase n=1 Tax=Eubacterium cellulosolvens (strain ATCC 43171 / JCM 9499 / 6) TaxID=633697 RepID=I5AQI3_EUBC6|nr:(d)CMP kinase [Eubacterium sp.]
MSFQIAIDGPAGAGKSTVAKRVAAELGFIYVDTGAMYRAMGLYFLDNGVDTDDEAAVNASLDGAEVTLEIVDGNQVVFLNGKDVNGRIRTEEAGMMASKTSAYAENRKKLVAMQQKIAASQNVVMDGRDIGTVVLPDAPLKIYLTASTRTRAERRYKELLEKGQEADLAAIEKDIEQRDYQDMHREHSPLRRADDAVLVDSSDLNIDEVVQKIVTYAKEKM